MPIIVSDNSALLDIPLLHRFLSKESTWARRIPYETVEKVIRNPIGIGGS